MVGKVILAVVLVGAVHFSAATCNASATHSLELYERLHLSFAKCRVLDWSCNQISRNKRAQCWTSAARRYRCALAFNRLAELSFADGRLMDAMEQYHAAIVSKPYKHVVKQEVCVHVHTAAANLLGLIAHVCSGFLPTTWLPRIQKFRKAASAISEHFLDVAVMQSYAELRCNLFGVDADLGRMTVLRTFQRSLMEIKENNILAAMDSATAVQCECDIGAYMGVRLLQIDATSTKDWAMQKSLQSLASFVHAAESFQLGTYPLPGVSFSHVDVSVCAAVERLITLQSSFRAAHTFLLSYVDAELGSSYNTLHALASITGHTKTTERPPVPARAHSANIAMLSSDFRSHPVGWSIGPILAQHHANQQPVHCIQTGTFVFPSHPDHSPFIAIPKNQLDVKPVLFRNNSSPFHQRLERLGHDGCALLSNDGRSCLNAVQGELFPFSQWPPWTVTPDFSAVCASLRTETLMRHNDISLDRALRSMNLHVLVDLNGMTKGGNSDTLSRRIAPVQLHFLGSTTTIMGDAIDWTVADSVVVVLESLQTSTHTGYHEPSRYLLLPAPFHPAPLFSYQHAWPAFQRHPWIQFALPLSVAANKRTLTMVTCWANILRKWQGRSKLLVLVEDVNSISTHMLISNFAAMGIPKAQIVLEVEGPRADVMNRLSQVDIMLDTNIFGAHSTAVDAIQAVVPAIFLVGWQPQQRVAASLASVLHPHHPTFLAHSLLEYEDVAHRLASVVWACKQRSACALSQSIATMRESGSPLIVGSQANYLWKAYHASLEAVAIKDAVQLSDGSQRFLHHLVIQ